jgi:hypothetical protein
MSWIVAVALLVNSAGTSSAEPSQPGAPVARANAPEAVALLAPQLATGSLLASKGDCLAVKIFSASSYTHVAAVVIEQPDNDRRIIYVYDSTGGAGVRRQMLEDYLAGQQDALVHVFNPRRTFPKKTARAFQAHLDSQLGRPYAISHHISGKRCEGLHCAEYCTDALIACDLLEAKAPPRVSPASLVEGILKDELYTHALDVKLQPVSEQAPASAGWCGRMWFDTCQCTSSCWSKVRGWVVCK